MPSPKKSEEKEMDMHKYLVYAVVFAVGYLAAIYGPKLIGGGDAG